MINPVRGVRNRSPIQYKNVLKRSPANFSDSKASRSFCCSFHSKNWEYLGNSVVDVGDWDGDGVGDYAVGSPGETVGGVEGHGRVRVFSGASGDQIAQSDSLYNAVDAEFGFALAGGFDADDDGLPELAVGAPGRNEVLILELGTGAFAGQLLVRQTIFAIDTPTVDLQAFGRTVVNVVS